MPAALSFDVIAERAAQSGDTVLVEDAVSGRSLTYREFRDEALRWAAALRRLGVSPETSSRVAVLLPGGADSFIAQTAIAWAGGQFVPVNAQLRGRPLAHVLTASRSRVLVTVSSFLLANASVLAGIQPELTVVLLDDDTPRGAGRIIGHKEFIDGPESGFTPVRLRGSDTRAIVFTSGTEGPAKPVTLSFTAMDSYGERMFPDQERSWPAGSGYYSPWSTAHGLGAVAMSVAVHRGMRLVVRDAFSAEMFWSDIRDFNCQLALTINVTHLLWAQPQRPDDADNPLQLLAMTPLIPQFRDFAARFDVQVSSIYGMTEIGPALTSAAPASSRSSGVPTRGYACRLVDADGAAVPPGEVGELVIKHEAAHHLMSGYDGMSEATRLSFRDGWFRTGDRFVSEDGQLCFVDRMSDSIRHHGRNISSFDVEEEVRNCADVASCACVGYRTGTAAAEDAWYDEDVRLFVVPRSNHELDPARLCDFLVTRLPRYMVPRYIEVVESIPTNASGRSLKSELRARPLGEQTWDRTQQRVSSSGHG